MKQSTERRAMCRLLMIGVTAFTMGCIASISNTTTVSATVSLTPTVSPSLRDQPHTGLVWEDRKTIAVYQTIIRRMYMQDDTYGGGLYKPILFIEQSTKDFAADPDTRASNSGVLPETVRQGITFALNDLPTWIVWIEHFGDVVRNPDRGCVQNKGVIISLSKIRFDETDGALVGGSISDVIWRPADLSMSWKERANSGTSRHRECDGSVDWL